MKVKDWIYPQASEIDTARDLEIIKKYLPEKGLVLDAGGGLGRIAIPLAKLGLRVVLLDISKTAINFAKERAKEEGVLDRIDFVEGDVCDLPFPDNHFDLVLALRDVINFSADQKRAVEELIRVLKPNHCLIVSVTNKAFWLTKLERWDYNLEKIKNILGTKSMLTEKELRNLFKGIKVEKIVGSGYCSGNIPENFITSFDDFLKIENFVGDDEELKFTCEYLVLIGEKRG